MSVETAVAGTSAGTGEADRPRRRRLQYALVLGGLTAFAPLTTDMYLPALPGMAAEFRTSGALIQLTVTVFLIGMGAGQLIAGPLSDAFGRRKPLFVGIGVYVVASVLCIFSPTAEILVIARALQALGAAATMVIARATVRDLYSGIAMVRFFSMLMLITGLAPILAPVVGAQVLEFTNWQGIFAILTAFGVVLLITAIFALPESLPVHLRRPARLGAVLRTYSSLLADRNFLGYALSLGFIFGALFAYISGSSFVFHNVYSVGPQAYSLIFGANGVGLVLMSQVNGRLVGRIRQRTLLFTGLVSALVAGGLLVVAVTLGLGLPWVLPPLWIAVSSLGLIAPNANSLALADYPDRAGSASALLGVLQFVIGGSLASLVGIAGEETAVPMAILMASFALLALLSHLLLTSYRTWVRTTG